MAYKRKWTGSQTQKPSQRTKYGKGSPRNSRKLPLAVKEARLARDLKSKLKMGLICNNTATRGSIGSTDAVAIMNGTYANWCSSNYPLGTMIEGDNETERVGRKIRLKHIDFCFFSRQQTTTYQAIMLCFELVQWKLYSSSTYGTSPNIQQ